MSHLHDCKIDLFTFYTHMHSVYQAVNNENSRSFNFSIFRLSPAPWNGSSPSIYEHRQFGTAKRRISPTNTVCVRSSEERKIHGCLSWEVPVAEAPPPSTILQVHYLLSYFGDSKVTIPLPV